MLYNRYHCNIGIPNQLNAEQGVLVVAGRARVPDVSDGCVIIIDVLRVLRRIPVWDQQ